MDNETIEKLREYKQLVAEGILTQEEFEQEKRRLMSNTPAIVNDNRKENAVTGMHLNDNTYLNAASKIEKFMEGALDEEISDQIKKRAIIGGLCMAIPLYGLEIIAYAICLWGEYGKISEISGVPFRKHAVRNIIGGFIINLIVTFVLNLIMELIPGLILSSIGGFVVGYASLEISGMGYVKMLKRLHGNKAKADLNIKRGIENMR